MADSTGKIIALIQAMGGNKGGGTVDPAVIEQAVSDWLDDHPEATTTVQDGSITLAKLDSDLKASVGQIETNEDDIAAIAGLESETSTGLITGFAQGGVNTSTGEINTSSTTACYVGKNPMKAGDKIQFSRSVNKIATTAYIIIYNASGTFVKSVSIANGNTYTFDTDGQYCISAIVNSSASATMAQAIEAANGSFNGTFDGTKEIVKTVTKHGTDIATIDTEVNKMNGIKLSQSDLQTGVYYKVENGSVVQVTESSAKYCPKVDVSAFRGMRMKVWTDAVKAGSIRAFGLCDAQGVVGNYSTEAGCLLVGDGGYYRPLIIDKDYMFFSCSNTPTTIRIEITGDDSVITRLMLDSTMNNGKYYHCSFDDVILCLQDITTNASTYTSIFENDLFGWCKQMHDLYGATFSFYVFYANDASNPTWTLEDCTNKFASEFSANADWMRFGLHAYAQGVNATGREAYAEDDYSDTITQLVRITGSVKCIDRVPRLHEYNGTLTALTAMRDCDAGPVGFIASADYAYDNPRDSYYFDSDQNAYIHQHYYMYDPETALHFVKTSIMFAGGNYDIFNLENMAEYMQMNRYVEVFQHENAMTSGNKSAMEAIIKAMSYSHKPYYMMDIVRTN